jgi:predicted amidohydrolase
MRFSIKEKFVPAAAVFAFLALARVTLAQDPSRSPLPQTAAKAPAGLLATAKIALVQPHNWERSQVNPGPDKRTQLTEADNYIRDAAAAGAHYVVFPEMYPGPAQPDSGFTAREVREHMIQDASAAKVWVFFSGPEPAPNGGQYNTCFAVSPVGKIAGAYRKIIPACGEASVPGDNQTPLVIDCDGLKVGLIICWEVWFPEMARMATVLGADVLFCPTGGLVYELTPSWKTLVAARAAENDIYTAACLNAYGLEDGMCVVYSPEGLIAERKGVGLLYADLDLNRLRYLRATDERFVVPKPYLSIPGMLRALPARVVQSYDNVMKNNQAPGTTLPQPQLSLPAPR